MTFLWNDRLLSGNRVFLTHCAVVNHCFVFVAPSTRADAVGNAIHSPEAKIGPIPIPHFIAKAFGLTDRGVVDELDPDLFIDEECYLGKNGDLSECADFDPKP